MSSTSATETYAVKLNYDGQMRRFPVAVGTSFEDLHRQVLALLALPKDADILLKYSDEEGDLITISSDLELNSALVPGQLLRLTVIGKKANLGGNAETITYPQIDAPMVDIAPSAPIAPHMFDAADAFRSGPQAPPHVHPEFAHAPGFAAGAHPAAPPPGFGPGFGGHHRGGPHGPYRGGLGFRGGFGHHGGRGGFGPHGRHGPYGHPHRGDMSPEDWRNFKKDHKEMRKQMKKEWKDNCKMMRKGRKDGGFRCADGMQWGWAQQGQPGERLVARFAKDVTIPDGTQLAPKSPFVKTWRLRNEGAEWPAGCVLRFLGKKSDKMGGNETTPLPIDGPVATNAEIDVSVNLVAPEKPGRYTGYWKLSTPDGRKFGQRVWVSIVVPGSPSSSSSSSSDSDSDKEADKYEALVDAVLATGLNVKRHRVFRMLQKTDGNVGLVCDKLLKKEEKRTRKAMKKQMKM